MERQPDSTAAEVVQRIPGAVVQRERGEADRVLIRGAESRLVSTTLDGERLASPHGDVRSAGIGLVPADLLEAVRVSKTITPDMDGDAIGGVVDLITRKAPASGLRTVDLAGGWDSEAQEPLAAGSFTLGRRFAQERFGVLFSASSHEADRGADQLQARYDSDEVERVELRDYALTRQRRGLAAALDSSPTATVALSVRGFFSSLTTDELRRRAKLDLGGAEIERELKDARLQRDIAALTVGSVHRLAGGLQVDYRLGAQRARQREPDRIDTSFVQQQVEFSRGGLHPAAANEDVGRFRLDKIGLENNRTEEEELFAAANLGLPITTPSGDLGVFRTGLKLRVKAKRQDTDTTIFEPDDDLFLASFLDPGFSSSGFLRGRYDLGPMVDREQARGLIERLGLEGQPSFEEEAADYRAGETTSAAYAMAELQIGERFSLLPGVRYERTASEYRGFEVFATGSGSDSSIRELAGRQSYGEWLPGVHAAYSLGDRLVLRGAVTRTLARPDYFDLVPFRIFDFEDAELELGNPDLRPTAAWNGDLGLQWRPGASTEVSLALFYKSIADFIFVQRGSEEISGERFEVTRPTNGHHATLQGIEVSLRHRLGERFGRLEGLGFELHYTATGSTAEAGELERARLRLPGQSSDSGLLLLGYERGRWFGNLALGYAGKYLHELGSDRQEDVHFDRYSRLDLAAGYSPWSRAELYLHLNNLTDEPLRMVQGSPGRPFSVEFTGRSARLGLKLRL